MKDHGKPTKAVPCHCANPLADARDMCCVWCGHQIGGAPMPAKGAFALGAVVGNDRSTFAKPSRKYRPAA